MARVSIQRANSSAPRIAPGSDDVAETLDAPTHRNEGKCYSYIERDASAQHLSHLSVVGVTAMIRRLRFRVLLTAVILSSSVIFADRSIAGTTSHQIVPSFPRIAPIQSSSPIDATIEGRALRFLQSPNSMSDPRILSAMNEVRALRERAIVYAALSSLTPDRRTNVVYFGRDGRMAGFIRIVCL